MTHRPKTGMAVALSPSLIGVGAVAQPEHGRSSGPRVEARQAEPHPGPRGYS